MNRGECSLQLENSANTLSLSYTDSEEQSVSLSLTASSTQNAVFCNGDIYVLKTVKDSLNQVQGCYFVKNGEDKSFNTDIQDKLALFDTTLDKHYSQRMGSYICTFPDGVVFETKNTDEALAYFKIEKERTIGNFLASTVYKSDDNRYVNVLEYEDGSFRADDTGVEEYIEDKGLWTGKPTYIKISTLAENNSFEGFNEGDSIYIKTYGYQDISGSIVFKDNEYFESSSSFRILEKGSESVNSYDRDYIIVNGFLNDKEHSKAFLNASNFEIRRDIFPTYSGYMDNELTITRRCPDIALVCESANRIWACSKDGHEIYASALGNPYSFYDFSGLSTDSYAVNVGTDGNFTACVNFLGHPMFFKENAVHIISGSYPSNGGEIDALSYSVSALTDFRGVEKGSEKSLAIIDNILYYKSSCGIVAFDGTNTTVISSSLGNERYKNAVGGAYNNKYYVSMQDSAGAYHLFVYDTLLGTWCREDNTEALQFIPVNNELLFIDAATQKIHSVCDKNILGFSDYEKEGVISWECETGDFGYSYPNNKYLSRLQLRLKLADGARAELYIQYDSDGIWHKKGDLGARGIQTHLLPIVPVRCDHMRIKLKGRGDVKIISAAKLLEEGGDC